MLDAGKHIPLEAAVCCGWLLLKYLNRNYKVDLTLFDYLQGIRLAVHLHSCIDGVLCGSSIYIL